MLAGGTRQTAAAPEQPAGKRKHRKISAASRKAIAEAQRKRWAASKEADEPSTPEAAPKPKRKLSAAVKATLVANLKKARAAKAAKAKAAVKKAAPARKNTAKKAAVQTTPAKAVKRAPVKKAAAKTTPASTQAATGTAAQ
jgi:hypothetical protein